MRVTYRRELKTQEQLRQAGFETFMPMKIVKKRVFGKLKVSKAPAVSSLLFIHSTSKKIQEFKGDLQYLQYIMTHDRNGLRVKATVPDKQMQDFIAVCGSEDERLLFMDPTTLVLKAGQRVRVLAGPCQGMIGYYQRVKGAREKRFVISIPHVVAVVTTEVLANQLMVVKDDEV